MSLLDEKDCEVVEEKECHPLGNPVLPPNVDLEMLRGDTIGDTVYSSKWCIETVMKLMQSEAVLKNTDTQSNDLSDHTEDKCEMDYQSGDLCELIDMDEDLQNQVGVLWDITSNEEVCAYLHSVGAIESLCYIIANSRCPRATEMCVGMLANVVTHDDMWKIIKSDTTIFNTIIPVLSYKDQPSLLEVMRFLNTALCHKEHNECYTRLWEYESLVTQEIARILSRSTHCDLLKQTTELAYNLLTLDEEESLFCASFAQGDFVVAVLEASKEIGYEYPSQAQNNVLDVIYNLTTYTSGALAMEIYLEQVASVQIVYLKTLCQDLSLSNHSVVLTALLSTLDHVYCRSDSVQNAVFSEPKVIRHVLKVLVTVYQRRGLYHLLSHSQQNNSFVDAAKKVSSSWADMDDTPTEKTDDARSWSERAAVSAGAEIKTPDASPLVSPMIGQRSKEQDISWSERRIGTPVDEFEDQWKRPRDIKRVQRKEKQFCEVKTINSNLDKDNDVVQHMLLESQSESSDGTVQNNTVSSNYDEDNAGLILYRERSEGGNSRRSTGFIPQVDIPHIQSDIKNYKELDGTERLVMSEELKKDSVSEHEDSNFKATVDGTDSYVTRESKFDSDEETTVDSHFIHFDDFEDKDDGNRILEDKYQTLFQAVREFLSDFIKTLTQKNPQSPNSSVKKMVLYMEKHCRQSEIKAMLICFASQKVLLEELVVVFEQLKTNNLLSATRSVQQQHKVNHSS